MKVLFRAAVLLFLLLAPSARAAAPAGAAGILILGDSNSEGPFGGRLYDALGARRDPLSGDRLKVSIYAKCAARADDWLDPARAPFICGAWICDNGRVLGFCPHLREGASPPLHRLYAALGAARHVTLVALGVNMLWGDTDKHLRDAAALAAAIRAEGSVCIWIGPPQTGPEFVTVYAYEHITAALRAAVTRAGCRFIRSDDKTDRRHIAPREDHYPEADAVAWADAVLDELDHPPDPADKPLMSLFGTP
jgi:hypothetical protein